jgi:hypothetical protein
VIVWEEFIRRFHPLIAGVVLRRRGQAACADAVEREVLLKEIDTCLSERPTEATDRVIFWLYYRPGLTARAIAAVPSIGLATAMIARNH